MELFISFGKHKQRYPNRKFKFCVVRVLQQLYQQAAGLPRSASWLSPGLCRGPGKTLYSLGSAGPPQY